MENISGEALPAETPTPITEHAAKQETATPPRAPVISHAASEALAKERLYLLVFGALVIGVAFWYLQFATQSICCGDFDAYYHFRWSRMLWEGLWTGHFPPSFDALPLTTLNAKDYVDHHFLFHVFQIPFTFIGDFQHGAKIGTWLFACLAVFSCYWLLLRYRISAPLVWLVAILGSSAPFLYRIHMGKAMSVSIVMLVAGIYLLFRRKYVWLLPLAFIFALTYDMVLLLLAGAGLWLLVVAWGEREFNREVGRAIVGVGLVVAGIILGNVINPYFPHNLQLLTEHALMKITVKDFSTAVGGEWYPYSTLEFLANCGPAFGAMVVGYIAFRDSTEKQAERPLFFLLFATFLMLVNMRWRRFSEYWPPFAILFAAFALQPFIERMRARAALGITTDANNANVATDTTDTTDEARASEETRSAPPVAGAWSSWDEHEAATVGIIVGALLYIVSLYTFMNVAVKGAIFAAFALLAAIVYLWGRGWGRGLVMAAALAVFGMMSWYHHITVNDIAGMPGPDRYRGGMEWIKQNVPPGEPVFNSDWDDFPKLFFYDPTRPFIAGLDPTYLLDKNPELMKIYERIGRGEEEDPGPAMKEKFCVGEGDARRCARYIFSDHEHEPLFNNALDSGWFDVAYEDEDSTILRLRDAKGDPPPDNVPTGEQKQEGATGENQPDDGQTNDEETKDEESGNEGESPQP